MLFSRKTRNIYFTIFAVLAALATLYHFAGIFYKVNQSPAWRHSIFVFINIFCIYGFLKRPKYFILFFSLLLMQQYYSHGTYMVNMWKEQQRIHWISLFDLILSPIALVCLVDDYCDKEN